MLNKKSMCNDCFPAEIKSFPDERSWTSFDLSLTKKLGEGKMKSLKFVHDGHGKDDGYYIYECLSCKEKWKLEDPDNARRGYFLKLSTVDAIITRLTTWQKVVLGFLILIVGRVIYELLIN